MSLHVSFLSLLCLEFPEPPSCICKFVTFNKLEKFSVIFLQTRFSLSHTFSLSVTQVTPVLDLLILSHRILRLFLLLFLFNLFSSLFYRMLNFSWSSLKLSASLPLSYLGHLVNFLFWLLVSQTIPFHLSLYILTLCWDFGSFYSWHECLHLPIKAWL